jgi:hypothetical protein
LVLNSNYAELDDLKRYLRIPGVYEGTINTEVDVYDDIILTSVLTAASRSIDQATNRQFGISDNTEAFTYTMLEGRRFNDQSERFYSPAVYRSPLKYHQEIDDLMTTSGLIIQTGPDMNTLTTITDYTLFPYNAAPKGRPWTEIHINQRPGEVTTVTAKWGWTAIPETIKAATLIQAARFFKRRDAPFGIAGSPDMGSELRLLSKLDPDVAVMVVPYKRVWGAV